VIGRRRRPDLSVVAVVPDIERAQRTLHALSAAYQSHLTVGDYEVIILHEGSSAPHARQTLEGVPSNFRLIRADRMPSPAKAINRGLAEARGEVIGVIIDGACIVTPGLLHLARRGARMFERAVVAAPDGGLGVDANPAPARDAGRDERREQALLASIDWPSDGYRLFEIASFDGCVVNGWPQLDGGANSLFMPRAMWKALGGVDEGLDAGGGGFLARDTLRRAVELSDAQLIVLLGEATVTRLGGSAPTVAAREANLAEGAAQYEAIRKRRWGPPTLREPPIFLGRRSKPVLAHVVRTVADPVRHAIGAADPRSARPVGEVVARVVAFAQAEFEAGRHASAAAVARLVCDRAPGEPVVKRLLAHATATSSSLAPPVEERARTHTALGEAYGMLGDAQRATSEYRAALALDGNLLDAHHGLARVRMPGDGYVVWLDRLHGALRPETYLEIGVDAGLTLALARPPTMTIGIDPRPSTTALLETETHIFPETSDAFFAARRHVSLLAGRPLKLTFIDGLHYFEQCLRDFINVEACCGPQSVIVLHDMVPLDERTQRRERETIFWTGDVWRTMLALKHYRPELDIFTIATGPTGLTVVSGLDPSSRILAEGYAEAIRRFMDVPFGEIESRLEETCNLVANDWPTVATRLRARGVF
jgi:hypothetical protein